MGTKKIVDALKKVIKPLKDVNLINDIHWGDQPDINAYANTNYPLAFIEYPQFYEFVMQKRSGIYKIGLYLLDLPKTNKASPEYQSDILTLKEKIEMIFSYIAHELTKSSSLIDANIKFDVNPTGVAWDFAANDGVWGYRYELTFITAPDVCTIERIKEMVQDVTIC